MPCYHLAIDIGASSGRHIVGWKEGGALRTEEVFRFSNGPVRTDGHLTWDIGALLGHVRAGIAAAKARFGDIETLSVDTWGCDYVLLRGDEEVLPCYCYRDSRTEAVIDAVHSRMPFEEQYLRIGCQFQPFNTVYQLFADREAGRLEGVTDFLMMPEYLMYKLTGEKKKEYTNATTTGMIEAATGEFDRELIARLGLPGALFPSLCRPGTEVGRYEGIRVILCATHDTASAVEGIPMEGNHPYISSGTWSLLGVRTPAPLTDDAGRTANYSNEGGVGYNRYQKNIMGMWLVNRLREELCPELDMEEIISLAEGSGYEETVDASASCFLAPERMRDAFCGQLRVPPGSVGDYFRCAFRSLALCYADALSELEAITGAVYDRVYIVGGGAKNDFLNRLTEQASGRRVIALPIEATALGNLKIQTEAAL